jgi:hypothetical protein
VEAAGPTGIPGDARLSRGFGDHGGGESTRHECFAGIVEHLVSGGNPSRASRGDPERSTDFATLARRANALALRRQLPDTV